MARLSTAADLRDSSAPERPTSRPKHLRMARNALFAHASRLGRSRAEITQAELAEMLGTNKQFVSKAESVLDEQHGFKAEHIALGPALWREEMIRTLGDASGLDVMPLALVEHDDNGARLQSVLESLSRLANALAANQGGHAVRDAARAVTAVGREATAYAAEETKREGRCA